MIISKQMDDYAVELYKNGEEVESLIKKVGCSKTTLYKILDENNIPRRLKKAGNKARYCRKCNSAIPINAKYCPECGSLCLTDKQAAINNWQYVMACANKIGDLTERQRFCEKCEAVYNYIVAKGLD